MIGRFFLMTMMMTAAAGSAWAQSPPAPPAPRDLPLFAALEPQAPPPPTGQPPRLATPAPPQPPTGARGAQPPAAPAAPAAPAPPAPRREGQPINVRVEVTITDRKPGVAPTTKTVTVVAGDGLRGSIRSEGWATQNRSNPLNVDVDSTILADNKVRLSLNLQYDYETGQSEGTPPPPAPGGQFTPIFPGQRLQIRDAVTMILESGKPLVVAQSADPNSDRQVTVEVKATILR